MLRLCCYVFTLYTLLFNVHTALCTLLFNNLYSVFFAPYTELCAVYCVFCILYSVLRTLYCLFCTAYSVFCIEHSVFCTLYVTLCTLNSVFGSLHSALLYTVFCTPYSCTLSSLFITLYPALCTVRCSAVPFILYSCTLHLLLYTVLQ